MLNATDWAALAVLTLYLFLFWGGNTKALRSAGRPVWLFTTARGRDHLAAHGFRAAFVLADLWPLAWLAVPPLPTLSGALLFLRSTQTQIRSEEVALRNANGAAYDRFLHHVPRWIGWPQRGTE